MDPQTTSTRAAETAAPADDFLSRVWDPQTARVLSTVLLFVVALAFLHLARETLTLFLFAVLFAYFLAPVVSRFERVLHGRGRAIAVVYLILIGLIAGLGFAVGPRLADETRSLATSIPSLLDRLSSGELVAEVGGRYHLGAERIGQLQQLLAQHRSEMVGYGKSLLAHLAAPAQHLWWLILIPILSLFFLKQGEDIATEAIDLGRSRLERRTIRGLVGDINVMLGSYIRAQIILAGLTLVAYTIVLSILRVPYAIVLGPAAGFLEFIPVVGPAVGAVTITVIAVLAGYPHAVWLVLFLGLRRLTQDYVSAPRIMGQSLEINPLLQIFSVLAGGEIAGVTGALVAVPVVATLRILWRRVGSKGGPAVPDAAAHTPTSVSSAAARPASVSSTTASLT